MPKIVVKGVSVAKKVIVVGESSLRNKRKVHPWISERIVVFVEDLFDSLGLDDSLFVGERKEIIAVALIWLS